MNLQKLFAQCASQRRLIKGCLEKIEAAKSGERFIKFDTILETLERKVSVLDTLNEKIQSNIDIDGMEDETLDAEEYSIELEIKLRHLKAYAAEGNLNSSSARPVHAELHAEPQQTTSSSQSVYNEPQMPSNVNTTTQGALPSSSLHRLPKLT